MVGRAMLGMEGANWVSPDREKALKSGLIILEVDATDLICKTVPDDLSTCIYNHAIILGF